MDSDCSRLEFSALGRRGVNIVEIRGTFDLVRGCRKSENMRRLQEFCG